MPGPSFAVASAIPAAVDHQAVVEQSAVYLLERLQLLQQVSKTFDVPAIDGLDDRQGRLRIVTALVVSPVVVFRIDFAGELRLVDAELVQRAVVRRALSPFALVPQRASDDPGEVGTQGDDQQVKHQVHVVAEAFRFCRPRNRRNRSCGCSLLEVGNLHFIKTAATHIHLTQTTLFSLRT